MSAHHVVRGGQCLWYRCGCTCMSQTWPLTILPSPHPPLSFPVCVWVCVCVCEWVCVCVCVCLSEWVSVCVCRCILTWKHCRLECLKTDPSSQLKLQCFKKFTRSYWKQLSSVPCDTSGWNAWGWLIPSTVGQSSASVNTVWSVERVTHSAQEQHILSHAQSKGCIAMHA